MYYSLPLHEFQSMHEQSTLETHFVSKTVLKFGALWLLANNSCADDDGCCVLESLLCSCSKKTVQ